MKRFCICLMCFVTIASIGCEVRKEEAGTVFLTHDTALCNVVSCAAIEGTPLFSTTVKHHGRELHKTAISDQMEKEGSIVLVGRLDNNKTDDALFIVLHDPLPLITPIKTEEEKKPKEEEKDAVKQEKK